MTGFGTSVFGTTPFGSGDNVSTYRRNTTQLAARAFDPLTKAYILDAASGAYAVWPRTRQRVWLAMSTRRGDLVGLPNWGIQLPTRVTPEVTAEVKAAVTEALTPIRECKIVSIDVSVRGSRVDVVVRYVDLDTGLPADLGVAYGT